MAGYGGYFLQGLSGGLQQGFGMAQQVKEMKWKREEKAKAKKAQDDFALKIGDIQTQAKQYAEGGWTGIEVQDFSALMHMESPEVQNYFKELNTAIADGDKKRVDEWHGLIKEFGDSLVDLDYEHMEKALNDYGANLKQPDAIKYFETYKKSRLISTEAQQKPQVERYASLEEFNKKYPVGTPFEHDKDGYVIPKYEKAPTAKAKNEYQQKLAHIENNPKLTKEEKFRAIYKIDTGIDIGEPNDTEDDFTTTEGARTLTNSNNRLFGYPTDMGRVGGIIPASLVRHFAMGRMPTEAEEESVMAEYNLQRNDIKDLLGTKSVEYMDSILDQFFRIKKQEEVVEGSLFGDAINKAKENINRVFGGEKEPTEETTSTPIETPTVSSGNKEALVPTMSKEEVKKALQNTDPADPLYKVLYDRAVKEGWIKE